MIANALFGIICLEYALSKTKKHRIADEERDKNYPAFRRYDAPKWSRPRLYPLAMTILPTRFFLFAGGFVHLGIVLSILTIGVDVREPEPGRQRTPIPIFRKKLI